jgi:WD repeat-containing protein 76
MHTVYVLLHTRRLSLTRLQVYTSSYDCTIRRTSFTSGISTELFALDDILISAFDFTRNGHELWISDTKGGVTHLDMREDRHEARRFQLSVKEKIGCVSLNPVDDWSLLASCNDRSLKYVSASVVLRIR